MDVGTLALKFTIIDVLSKGLIGIKDRLKAISSSSAETQRSFDRMVKSFKWAAIAGVATKEMYKGFKKATSLAGDLQYEMLGVKAELMRAGKPAKDLEERMRKIKATAFSVQSWTPFDMTQIVALEKELVKAGAKLEDVIGDTGAAAATAALTVYENLDPTETGKALIGIGTPFKITADKYMELADTISRAASASTVGAAEIAETAKYAAAPMAELGRSTKEMAALSAVLAQSGIAGSMAGTALKGFFSQAAKHKMFQDAQGNLLPTVQIVEMLRQKYGQLGEAQQMVAFQKLFGERGYQVALALLQDEGLAYAKILAAMDEGISLQDKLNVRMSGFKAQLESLKGTCKSTIADLFQPALKPLTEIVSKTNEFIVAIGKASQKKESISKAVSGFSMGTIAVGGATTAALTAGALYYGSQVLMGAGGIKGLLKGGVTGAGQVVAGKEIAKTLGVTPVYVTNWPAALTTGGLLGGPTGIKGPGALGKLGKTVFSLGGPTIATGAAGVALLGGAAFGTGYTIMRVKQAQAEANVAAYEEASKRLWHTLDKEESLILAKRARKLTETYEEKKKAGASEDELSRILAALEKTERKREEITNQITLQIQIDEQGRTVVETKDMNTTTKINTVKRGRFAEE